MEIKIKKSRYQLLLEKVAILFLSLVLFVPIMAFNVRANDDVIPRVVDSSGLLSSDELVKLEEKLNEISTRQEVDVVIVTVDSLEGKTATEYADDFYDYSGYGFEDSKDGILLLVSMGERDWAISTTGWGITVFTDAGLDYMTDRFIPYLSDGEYYKAFNEYAKLCDKFITKAYDGNPYDVGHLPKTYFKLIWIPISLVLGFLVAFIMASAKKKEMKSIIKQSSASHYTKDGSVILTQNSDNYVTRRTFTRIISRDISSGGSSGGSSTHTSSSGTSHGGSSGKF